MKIIVIGCPGSGKSYFSIKLAKIIDYPVYHLDKLFWKENWVETPYDEFIEKQRKIFQEENYIIDGNYQKTLEERFIHADIIYFLDISEEVCLESEKIRRGSKRDDLPSYLIEEYDPDFINYIKNFKNSGRIKILEYIKRFENKEKKVIVFSSRNEVNQYLSLLKKEDLQNENIDIFC